MRIATFDIECSSLDAVGAGFMLCCVVRPLGKKPLVFRYDKLSCKPGRETTLVNHVVEELNKYNMLVGHNIARFDFPYIKSRCIQLGLKMPDSPFIYDTLMAFRRTGYKTVPNAIGKPSAGLGHVCDFFDLPQKKTAVYPREWWKAVWQEGEKKRKAMDNIVSHCVADTLMNEMIYWKLLEFDRVWGIRRAD
jgi:uncharacterized protein YprB with RNaseH-like and TPR domain